MADFMGLMKQAAQLQSKMQAMQAELDTIEVEGAAGGGMVTVRLSAKGEMRGAKIDPSLMKPDETAPEPPPDPMFAEADRAGARGAEADDDPD